MKWIIVLVAMLPALTLAAGAVDQHTAPAEKPPSFGLSNNVIDHQSQADREDQVTRETRHLLNQQANSKPADHSEISAPVYVETQQRLSKSFTQDIKEFGKNQTTQGYSR